MMSYVLCLSLLAVSAFGYELNTHPQYLPVQQTPYQNGHSIYYNQVPFRTYNTQSYPSYYHASYPSYYPVNYVNQGQRFYTPYSQQYQYQPIDTVRQVQQVAPQAYPVAYTQTHPEAYLKTVNQYPVKQEATQSIKDLNVNKQEVPSTHEQVYASYPHGVNQPMGYPKYNQEERFMVKRNQQQVPHFAYQTKDDFKVAAPVKSVKPVEQEDTIEKKEDTPKMFFPFEKLEDKLNQEIAYRTYRALQKENPEFYAQNYPQGYYPVGYQGLPEGYNMLPNKPVIHVKYDFSKGYPHQFVKEQVLQNIQKQRELVNEEEIQKNVNKVDTNQMY